MKVILDVKSSNSINKPEKNTVLMYNGKEWYTVRVADLMLETETRHKKAFERLEKEYELKLSVLEERFKKLSETVTKQNETVINLVEGLITKE